MNICRTSFILVLLFLCLCACTKTVVKNDLAALPGSVSGEGIVLLTDFASLTGFNESEAEDCLRPRLQKAAPNLRIIPAQKFRQNIFPYFIPSTTPHTPEEFQAILAKPIIQKQLKMLGVRYILLFNKSTTMERKGGMACSPTGCLGGIGWSRQSEMGAVLGDSATRSYSGSAQALAKGKGMWPIIILPVPLPLYISATESAACKELSDQLGKAFSSLK